MCVDWRITALVANAGLDVVHARDIGLARAPDTAILQTALSQGRFVVTHDSDFGKLLAYSNAEAPSVVRLRLPLASHKEVATFLLLAIAETAQDLERGAIVSVSEERARVRLLPLAGPPK